MRTPIFAALSSFVLACAASGAGEAPPATSPTANATASTDARAAAPSAEPRTTSLRRSAVQETIARGLGAFLRNVAVEDTPVLREGRFVGFRIKALSPDFQVELRPGDVVTRVNGMPIEHPEEADDALRSLEKASSLRVDYERDGKARALELPIVDDDGKRR